MESFDISKRAILKVAGAGIIVAASGGIVKPANADPVTFALLITGGVLSSVISGLFGLASKKDDVKNAIETEQKTMVMRRMDYFFNSLPINEQLALFRDGTYYKAIFSGDFDRFGTLLAVTDGRIHLARGRHGDKIHSDMAMAIGNDIIPETGICPVPVKNSLAEDDRVNEAASEFIADKMKITKQEYQATFSPKVITGMSLAKNPTLTPDFSFFTSLNKKESIRINNQDLSRVAVHVVPQKIIAPQKIIG